MSTNANQGSSNTYNGSYPYGSNTSSTTNGYYQQPSYAMNQWSQPDAREQFRVTGQSSAASGSAAAQQAVSNFNAQYYYSSGGR